MTKYSLDQNFLVDVIYKEDLLPEENTLIDVAYSYNWRKVRGSNKHTICKILSCSFQTSPMRFYYRIYQKTKVLTRKRKKKSTKTNNKNHPAKKRKADTAPVDPATPQNGNGMEVDEKVERKPNKISPKLNGEAREAAKEKAVKEKEVKKVVAPVIKNSSPKVSFGGVETKPLKSVTINHNISYSSEKTDRVPSKAKPLSPILKNGNSEKNKLLTARKPAVVESKPKSNPVTQNSIKPGHQPSKKQSSPVTSSSKVVGVTQSKPVRSDGTGKKSFSDSSKSGGKEKVTQLPAPPPPPPAPVNAASKTAPTSDKPLTNGVKPSEAAGKQKTLTVTENKPVSKIIPEPKKQPVENQVVEISVEVSASDIKKVLEKKKAEKDAKLISNGEERLFSNYSIVDQLKKSNAAANLANQKKQASMMDFTRSSEAFSPKVPPTIQGLQPKANGGGSETNVLSAIVHSLAQKQQFLNQKVQAVTSNNETKPADKSKEAPASVKEKTAKSPVETDKTKQSDSAAKTLGNMVAPTLSTKTGADKTVTTPKLPISTSIKAITTESPTNSTTETSAVKGSALSNLFPNKTGGGKTNNTGEAAKNAESLTKNIPAGTTVTVKTVTENKQTKVPSPSSTPTSKNSPGFRMNLSNSTFALGKGANNSYSSANVDVMSQTLMNQQLSLMAAQHVQQQYNNMLNFNAINQLEAAAYLKNTAANILRASAKSPMTTLAFTKPISSDESRLGLNIPQPSSRQSSPTLSSFGTSRLQVKVNSDSEKTEKGSTGGAGSGSNSHKLKGGSHSLPAQLPFHDMKKVHAIPKSLNSTGRSPISSLLKTQNTSTKSPPLTSSPPKSPVVASKPLISSTPSPTDKTGQSPVKTVGGGGGGGKLNVANKPVNQVNSLKKLVADLNSVQKKKAENLLNTLQKSQENKLLNEKKSFLGLDQNITEKQKEVTSS